MDLKRFTVSLCRVHGFTLNSEATHYLVSKLSKIAENDREYQLQKIIDALNQQTLDSPLLTKLILQRAIEDVNQFASPDPDKILNVIDAFQVPHFTYNPEKRKLIRSDRPSNLQGTAEDKKQLFHERYSMLHQRTSRHQLFVPPVPGTVLEEDETRFQLKPIEYLLATTSRLGNVLVLGMLSQLKEGSFYLEDCTGAVQLDLTTAKFHTGLITECCFVLAEGSYDDGMFHVKAVGFPPPELAQSTRSYFGNENFFGGPFANCAKTCMHLQRAEVENSGAVFVFLSDVWLNEIKVQNKLKTLFSGFSESPPACFVLIGNFISGATDSNTAKLFEDSLKTLSNSILDHPSLMRHSKFVFVPGPRDPGMGNILPRPQIPTCLTKEFRRKIPTAIFTTNPCRIQFCTQEMVIFREDIIKKFCRSVVHYPTTGDIPDHFATTVISQSHLCPLPLHVVPVHWSYDHALRLYPLPDLIVCADKYSSFCVSNMECTVLNPGSFSTNNFNFKVYTPATKEVDDSQIDDDD